MSHEEFLPSNYHSKPLIAFSQNADEQDTNPSPAPFSSPTPALRQRRDSRISFARTFTSNELRQIGAECANRLPPASIFRDIFVYESNRETDSERLVRKFSKIGHLV
jgi:hypothetical protein